MAENILIVRSQADKTAGRKSPAAVQNRLRVAVIQTVAAYTAPAQNDTIGTGLIIPQGARFLLPITLSNGAGTASSTLAVGIRDPITKVAISADAVMAATAIASAATAQVNTGTKCITGQEYFTTQDVELYLTVAGAAGLANQQIRVEVPYLSP
jgi:hypothetical protein